MSAKPIFFKDLPELYRQAAQTLLSEIKRLAENEKQVVIGLCGGRSVAEIFKIVTAEIDSLSAAALAKLRIFMVDERMVPLRHADSNFNIVDEFLAKPLIAAGKLKSEQFFAFNGANPRAVESYNRDLGENGGRIHIVLLSSGEDGHVAALFPDHPSIANEGDGFIDFHESPKPPEHRMSASRKLILKAGTALLLMTGEAKQKAFENYKNPSLKVTACPAKMADQIPAGFLFTDRS